MKTSESISKISAALLKAQRNIGAATKGSNNPFFKSKYADLGSVMEACKGALNDEGISVLQPVQSDGTGEYVETTLLHESGEYITSSMKLILSKQDMQAYGSAISYCRRYSLQSLMFIPAEDDDSEKAMSRPAKSSVPAPTVTTVHTAPAPKVEAPAPAPVEAAPAAEVPKYRSSFRKSTPAAAPAEAVATEKKDSLNF